MVLGPEDGPLADLVKLIERYRAALAGSKLGPRTALEYVNPVQHFVRYLQIAGRCVEISALGRRDFEGFFAWMKEVRQSRPETVRNHLGTIKRFLKWRSAEEPAILKVLKSVPPRSQYPPASGPISPWRRPTLVLERKWRRLPSFIEPLQGYLRHLEDRGKTTKSTIALYSQARYFVKHLIRRDWDLDPKSVHARHLRDYFQWLNEERKVGFRESEQHYYATRRFFLWMRDQGQLGEHCPDFERLRLYPGRTRRGHR